MKKLIFTFILFICVTGITNSQLREKDNLLGGTLGFWAKGNSPMLGVNFESEVVQAGIGTIGVGGLFRYYTFTNTYSNGNTRRYSFSSLGVQGNYNFNEIGNGSFVPFLGLVLGYNHVNTTYTNIHGNLITETDITYNSGAWMWAQGGFRYFFNNNVAGSVRAGFGNNDFNTLELGVDIKL